MEDWKKWKMQQFLIIIHNKKVSGVWIWVRFFPLSGFGSSLKKSMIPIQPLGTNLIWIHDFFVCYLVKQTKPVKECFILQKKPVFLSITFLVAGEISFPQPLLHHVKQLQAIPHRSVFIFIKSQVNYNWRNPDERSFMM